MSDDVTFWDEIEAYCGVLSCEPGESIPLHVSTKADAYSVVVERWGATREEVWRSGPHEGRFHEAPADADTSGCRWPVAIDIPTKVGWRSGFHLVTVTATGVEAERSIAHACFVVRAAPAERSKTLFVLGTNTWNAYNIWGGRSLYTGGNRVSFQRPFGRGMLCRPEVERDDRKARPVRWGEEPDADGEIFQEYRFALGYPSAIGSTGWFTHERRFVEWAEGEGRTFDTAVSADLQQPGALDGYDLVVCVGHDEYWTAEARDSVDSHIAGGGHFATFSGNTMFWQVRLEDDNGSPGVEHMVCHKYSAHQTDESNGQEMTGLWCDPVVQRPEWTTLGAGSLFGLYHRFGQATPRGAGAFTVFRQDHWLLADTDLGYGDQLGQDDGVVGYETVGCPLTFDEFQLPVARPHAGLPEDLEIVAFCLSSNLGVGEYPKSIAALSDQGDLEFMAERIYGDTSAENLARVHNGNSVMLTCRPAGNGGGEVVTIGTTDWVFGLAGDRRVQQVTANILDRYVGS